MKKLFYALFMSIFFLSGCSTPYQAYAPFSGGYKENKLREGVYELRYVGASSWITKENVLENWNRRAAELCEGEPQHIELIAETQGGPLVWSPVMGMYTQAPKVPEVNGVVYCTEIPTADAPGIDSYVPKS